MSSNRKQVIIIGSGPAGLTAAIYTARALIPTIVISGREPGGQLMGTTMVDNFPGFPEGILGPDLMSRMRSQAKRFAVEFVEGEVTSVDFQDSINKVWVGDKEYQGDAIIIATGSHAKKLEVPGEKEFLGRGVSTCATCDGYFFRDKKVAVVGGGDSALEEALFLSRYASEVVVIHRRADLKASKIMQKKAFEDPKIQFMWNSVVEQIIGEAMVRSVIVKNMETSQTRTIAVDGVFVAIGHVPATSFLKGQIALDEKGYIIADAHTRANIPGVFVAGDAADPRYRQAITSAGEGCKAALEVEKYLNCG